VPRAPGFGRESFVNLARKERGRTGAGGSGDRVAEEVADGEGGLGRVRGGEDAHRTASGGTFESIDGERASRLPVVGVRIFLINDSELSGLCGSAG